MIKRIKSKINKDKFSIAIKLTAFIFGLVCIINLIDVSYSRYESNANMDVKASIAFFVIDQGTYNNSITLDGLLPSNNPYIYTIYLKNYTSAKRLEVDLTYHVTIETTTNLPLTVQVFRNEEYSANATSAVSAPYLRQDGDVYYRVYETTNDYTFGFTSDQTDYYTVVVTFPETYKYYPDLYQGKIDLLSVIIDAEQVV